LGAHLESNDEDFDNTIFRSIKDITLWTRRFGVKDAGIILQGILRGLENPVALN
jgi:hypothetical protein